VREFRLRHFQAGSAKKDAAGPARRKVLVTEGPYNRDQGCTWGGIFWILENALISTRRWQARRVPSPAIGGDGEGARASFRYPAPRNKKPQRKGSKQLATGGASELRRPLFFSEQDATSPRNARLPVRSIRYEEKGKGMKYVVLATYDKRQIRWH